MLPSYKDVPKGVPPLKEGETYSSDGVIWVITKDGKIVVRGIVERHYHYYIVAVMSPVYTPCFIYRGDMASMGAISFEAIDDALDQCEIVPQEAHRDWSGQQFRDQTIVWRLPLEVINVWDWYEKNKKDVKRKKENSPDRER